MLFLFLAIVTSIFVVVILKLFDRYNVNSFYAITVNYLVCIISGIISFRFIHETINSKGVHESLCLFQGSGFKFHIYEWMPFAVILGFSFIGMFNFFAISISKIGAALTTVSSKMSVVIPIYFGILLHKDKIDIYKITGIIFTLLAFYFIFKKEKNIPFRKVYFFFPLLLFIGNGFNDTLQTYCQRVFHMDNSIIFLFMIVVFSTALIIGIIILLSQLFIRILNKNTSLYSLNSIIPSIIGGLLLGIFNFSTTFYFLKSVGYFPATFIFPVFNVCIVGFTALIGFFFFKEKLRPLNWLGMLLAIFAIIIIAIG